MTLIELLTVMACIALCVSILVPSIGAARGQARTTVCAVRLAELTRAMFLYAQENGDVPPFIGRGWENLDSLDDQIWPTGSGLTLGQLKRLETWCLNQPDCTWSTPQEDWPADVSVRNGSLFRYTRFENLYRCPEFEAVPSDARTQGAFNYTRTVLGRKWYVPQIDDEAKSSPSAFGTAGPIMKISEVYSPAKMWMLMDEWWLRHCAAPVEESLMGGSGMITGGWMGTDCMNFYLGDELGRYHGAPVKGLSSVDQPSAVRRGTVSFYDGHVELLRDVLPGRSLDFSNGMTSVYGLLDFLVDHLFAQRGLTIDVTKVPVPNL